MQKSQAPRPPTAAGPSMNSTAAGDNQLHTTIQVLSECGKPQAEISQILGINEATVNEALSQDRYAIAATFLANKKMPFANIAQVLNMSEARVHGAIYGEGSGKT